VDAGGQMPHCAARGGMDEADQIAPLEPMAHDGDRTVSNRRPDPSQERLQADTMLVDSPHLDLGVGEGGRHLPQQRTEVFLKASCSPRSAWAWRGRGSCWLCLSRWR